MIYKWPSNKLMTYFILLFNMTLFEMEAEMVKANGIEISYDAFGNPSDPAYLLIIGSGGQSICWPTQFCEQLADQGFYVIRYDQRDAGQSTCINFQENPYNLLDLAHDAAGLLDSLNIQEAHLFGLSMGGPIAELIAVHFPEKVKAIAIMGSAYDLRPFILSLNKKPQEPGLLSSPLPKYVLGLEEIYKMPSTTLEEKIQQRVSIWNLLNGSVFPLDQKEIWEMQRQFLVRTVHMSNLMNYRLAMHASEKMVREIHHQINVPTVILHGSEDILFGQDHPETIHKEILNSTYYYLEGMGHIPNPHFYDFLIQKLTENAKSTF